MTRPDPAALLDATAAALGLPIAPEHRPGVLRYLDLVSAMAALVMDFPLTPADEPGSVFQPVSPRAGRAAEGAGP